MRIGELAADTHVPVRTIRYYEDRGVIPAPERTPAGYRDYTEDAVATLKFLTAAKAAGLTLAEISSTIQVRDEGEKPCGHVTDLLVAKRAEIRGRIENLTTLASELDSLITRAKKLNPADCLPSQICHVITEPRSPEPSAR